MYIIKSSLLNYSIIGEILHMKPVRIFFFLLLTSITLICLTPSYAESDSPDYILLQSNWQYLLGDSPTGSDSLPLWINESNLSWNKLESLSKPLDRPYNENTAWFRIKIPMGSWNSPSVYFEELRGQNITIYLKEKVIYHKEDNKNTDDMNQIILPLEEGAYGQYLYVRTNSITYPRLGPSGNVYFGDYQKVSLLFLRKGFLSEMSGFALVFMAICLLIISFLIHGSQRKAVIALAFAIASAGFILATYHTSFTVRYPQYKEIVTTLFGLFIIGFFISITIFFEEMFGAGYKKIIHRSWQVLILITIILISTEVFNSNELFYYIATNVLGILAIVQFIMLVTAAVYYSFKGNLNAKIFMAGFSIFAIILVTEMMIFLFYSNNYKFFAFKWGIIIFLMSQIIILGRKIALYHNQVIAYSKELESKNKELDVMWNEVKSSRDKLAELNKTLESKVAERTRQIEDANEELVALNEELSASNIELTDALEMLKNTQEQLIKSEKMAALGQLVSGIAHELNTPLGAIQASINNIYEYTSRIFSMMPDFFTTFTPQKTAIFLRLLKSTQDFGAHNYISTKDERINRRSLTKELTELGIKNPEKMAEQLSSMGIYDLDLYKDVLENPDNNELVEMAFLLSCFKRSTHTISLAAEKTTKVVFALKSYSHQGILETTEVDITDGIETVLTIYHNKIKHGVEIVKHYSELPKIKCNPDELTQVWTNIIHNALQAMEYKGILTIKTFMDRDYVVVSITDSGPGIPDEIKGKIFQPFFTTKPQGEGTGLGLDIASKIIDKHNGWIEADGKPGQTTFKVYIPKTPKNR